MTTEKYLERMKRIAAQRKVMEAAHRKITQTYQDATKEDRRANQELSDRGLVAIYKMVKDERDECKNKCCKYECRTHKDPDEVGLHSDGIFYVRWDADHPNDIVDREYSIEDFLSENSKE